MGKRVPLVRCARIDRLVLLYRWVWLVLLGRWVQMGRWVHMGNRCVWMSFSTWRWIATFNIPNLVVTIKSTLELNPKRLLCFKDHL